MKSRAFGVAMAIAVTSIVFAGCGGGGTTTVTEAANTEATTEIPPPARAASEARIEKIEAETQEAELEAAEAKKEAAQATASAKKAAARQAHRAAARNAAAEAESEEEESSTSEPPDVIGMKLPEAEAELSSAGFQTVAENTDTAFGIVIKSHYTICEETPLGGNNVRVLAQKYGC